MTTPLVESTAMMVLFLKNMMKLAFGFVRTIWKFSNVGAFGHAQATVAPSSAGVFIDMASIRYSGAKNAKEPTTKTNHMTKRAIVKPT